jgi:hypothetical protein
LGSTAKALTRPEVTAGPMERNLKPENTEEPIGSGVGVGVGSGVGVGDVGTTVALVESPAGVGDGEAPGCAGRWAKNVEKDSNVKQTRAKVKRRCCTAKAP